ncbi:MAG: hypothetical protein U0N62_11075, partial [Hydrogeniiclostridium sp.]
MLFLSYHKKQEDTNGYLGEKEGIFSQKSKFGRAFCSAPIPSLPRPGGKARSFPGLFFPFAVNAHTEEKRTDNQKKCSGNKQEGRHRSGIE